MKKGLKSYFVLLALGLALPFLMGLNCCCFAKQETKPSCHAPVHENCGSHAAQGHSDSKCQCSSDAVLSNKDVREPANILTALLKNGVSFVSLSNELPRKTILIAFHFHPKIPQAADNFIYLSSIHAQAPPLA